MCRCGSEAVAGPLACQVCEEKIKMLKFTLPITPTAQARPKVAVRGRFARAYKTKDQQANERTLEACLLAHKPKIPLSGPLALDFIAALPIPKSASKKDSAAMLSGEVWPSKKPDLDNLAKQLKDAMTRMQFWHDDCQIVSLRCDKIYHATGFWCVSVHEPARKPI
jgi:Holliday junction resolvase RusA-like endonuclease